jgi:6-phosphogluconolactonase
MSVMSWILSSGIGILVAGILLASPIPILKHGSKPEYFLYVASGAQTAGKGIYLYKLSSSDATLTSLGTKSELAGVASLARHPSNKFLYAVKGDGSIASFAIHHETGDLRPLKTLQSQGKGSCFGIVDRKGWILLVAHCGAGNAESFRVDGDGAIGESVDVRAQSGPNSLSRRITITPDNFFILIPALDKVFQYRFDPAHATFWPNDPPSVEWKSGKDLKALAFRPDEKFAYAVDEAASSVDIFTYNREKGTLAMLESVAAPGNPSAIEVDQSGRFLYVLNSGDDSISVFSIDGKRGTLKSVQRVPAEGKNPRYFQIEPTGRFLLVADRDSNRIVLFEIDHKSGSLSPASKTIDVPSPACFQLVPASGPEIH